MFRVTSLPCLLQNVLFITGLGVKSAVWRPAMATHFQVLTCQSSVKENTVKFTCFSRVIPWYRRLVDRPFTAESRARSQVSPCDICDRQSVNGTGFCPSTSVFLVSFFPLLLHTHLHLHVALTRRTKGRSLGTLQEQCSVGNRWELDRKLVALFYFYVLSLRIFSRKIAIFFKSTKSQFYVVKGFLITLRNIYQTYLPTIIVTNVGREKIWLVTNISDTVKLICILITRLLQKSVRSSLCIHTNTTVLILISPKRFNSNGARYVDEHKRM